MAYSYLFGGLQIESDEVVIGLQPIERAPLEGFVSVALAFEDGPPPPSDRLVFSWSGSFDLRLWSCPAGWLFTTPRFGSIGVSADGKRLTAYRQPGAPLISLHNLLTGRVLPRVATLRGRLVLHAASVERDGKALLLLGASGMGKSTLSTGLSQLGWTLLSDDASVLDEDVATVWQSSAGASLWPDARAALKLSDHAQEPLDRRPGKHWVAVRGGTGIVASPVHRLLFLNRSDAVAEPRLHLVSKLEATGKLLPQLLRFDPTDRAAAPRYMRAIARLTDKVPAYVLDYPSNFQNIPATGDLLADELLDAAA